METEEGGKKGEKEAERGGKEAEKGTPGRGRQSRRDDYGVSEHQHGDAGVEEIPHANLCRGRQRL